MGKRQSPKFDDTLLEVWPESAEGCFVFGGEYDLKFTMAKDVSHGKKASRESLQSMRLEYVVVRKSIVEVGLNRGKEGLECDGIIEQTISQVFQRSNGFISVGVLLNSRL